MDASKYDERTTRKSSSSPIDVNDLYRTGFSDYSKTSNLEKGEKTQNRLNNSVTNNKMLEQPLAVSTPRSHKPAQHSTPIRANTEYNSSISGSKPTSTTTGGYEPYKPKSGYSFSSSKYDNPNNLRQSGSNSNNLPSRQTSAQLASNTRPASKTKEVVEIKHRNSVELDPSKSFKPINPDNSSDPRLESTSTSQYRPISLDIGRAPHYPPISIKSSTYTSSNTRPNYTSSIAPRTSKPYTSSYEPSTYISKYGQYDSRGSEDCKNTSADSAYGSPSRSYSKLPSTSSYSKTYRSDHTLPSITSHSKYGSSSSHHSLKYSPLSKVPPLRATQQLITA